MNMERLQKVMAHAGIASRRKSEKLIKQGIVKVNNQVIKEPGFKVNPAKDNITVNGKSISKEKKVYILLNKPTGYITTTDDPYQRKTVLDLIDDIPQRVYPVGRLDRDSRGLLLLTNDGKLTHKITHPSHEIKKEYLVEIQGSLTKKDLNKLENGIHLGNRKTAPAKAKIIRNINKNTIFSLTITEGRNRQVRRMCEKIGYKVIDLKRIRLNFLTLDGLKEGEFRYLKKEEINKLKNI